MRFNADNLLFEVVDVETKSSALMTEEYSQKTMIKISGSQKIPSFTLHKSELVDRIKDMVIKDMQLVSNGDCILLNFGEKILSNQEMERLTAAVQLIAFEI